MKKAIKILSLVMAVLLAVLCFAGCGAKKEEEKPTIVIGYTLYEPMNYLDDKFMVFNEYEVYLWVMVIATILTALITAYLAIRHFVQISKRRIERGRE